MPAYIEHRHLGRPRERVIALAAVVAVQSALGLALLMGLRVDMPRAASAAVQRLIAVTLLRPPPPPQVEPPQRPEQRATSASKTEPAKLGGAPAPTPAHALASVAPIVAVRPNAPPSGGGIASGPAVGSGAGGGAGRDGYGAGEGGGTDLEQIAGAITPRDYPRRLREAGRRRGSLRLDHVR